MWFPLRIRAVYSWVAHAAEPMRKPPPLTPPPKGGEMDARLLPPFRRPLNKFGWEWYQSWEDGYHGEVG
jgi:hypothetical protein